MNSYYYPNSQNSDYDYNPDAIIIAQKPQPRPLNGLEKAIIGVAILAMLLAISIGFWVKGAENLDKQKYAHITKTILPALNDFYKNSSASDSARFYPKSICINPLNSVDYEFTLRRQLTGQVPEIDNHAYISPDKFPNDPQGIYSKKVRERQIPHPCLEKFNLDRERDKDKDIYSNFSSCNFSSSNPDPKYRNCYLYTSTPTGDKYSVGYYSEVFKVFVVFEKFRAETTTCNLQWEGNSRPCAS
jgi:hypothetical protein